MTSPSIAASSSGVTSPANTTTTIAITALSAAAGDLLMSFHFYDGNLGEDGTGFRNQYPSGWVVAQPANNTTSSVSCQFAYKFATGGETDFNITHSSAITRNRTYRITGHAGSTRPPLWRSWQGANSAGPPNVDAREWKVTQDILSILGCAWENTTPSGGVTGYTNDFNAGSGSLGGRCERQAISGFTGSEDPANYTTGSGNRAGYTVLIPSDAGDPDLTFPIVRNDVGRTDSAAASNNSVVIRLPTQFIAGDIIFAAIGLVANVTISSGLPDGWVTEVSVQGGGAGGERMYLLWKIAEGNETDFTLTMSGNSIWVTLAGAIFNVDSTSVDSATATGGANTSPDPPNLTADAELWMAMSQQESASITAFPTDYTHRQEQRVRSSSIAYAFRQIATSSQNPGPYTSSGSFFWTTATVAFGTSVGKFFSAWWVDS